MLLQNILEAICMFLLQQCRILLNHSGNLEIFECIKGKKINNKLLMLQPQNLNYCASTSLGSSASEMDHHTAETSI